MEKSRFYDEIMALKESEDIKTIVKRWMNFSANKVKFNTGVSVVLPDMLWVSRSGYGATNLLELLSGFMSEVGIIEFYGDVKFFEFRLEYSQNDSEIFDKFKDEVLNAAGFRNEYRGIVCVDISAWLEHMNDGRFVRFLEYLSENSEKWHIIFLVNTHNEKRVYELETILSVYFRIDKVVFSMPKSEELFEYMRKRIESYGFSVDDAAGNMLVETIGELRKSKYFDGYKTLNMICADLVYRAISSENFGGYTITAEIAAGYSKESDFIRRIKSNIVKKQKIGFELCEEGQQ